MPDSPLKTISNHIDYTLGGKKLPPSYDWNKDERNYKIDGHIANNRCYHCGYKFVGSQYAAFCNICDNSMSMGDDITVASGNKIVMRSELIAIRVRIPDDIPKPEPESQQTFMSANELV